MTNDQCSYVDELGRRCQAVDLHFGDAHVFIETRASGHRVRNRRAVAAEQERDRLRGLLRQFEHSLTKVAQGDYHEDAEYRMARFYLDMIEESGVLAEGVA